MNRTDEQQEIISHVGTKQNFVGQARAGTGKTTTGRLICQAFPKRKFKYVAFTNSNANDLKAVMPSNVDCSTWNSYGFSSMTRRGTLDKYKMANIVADCEEYNIKSAKKEDIAAVSENHSNMVKLCNLVRNLSLNPDIEDVKFLLENYDVSLSLPFDKVASDCIKFVEKADRDHKTIDFIDQIRMPILSDSLRAGFDIFINDESQDNPLLRTIGLGQLAKKGVQVGAFGDDFQSMYGFMGADCKSMEHIIHLLEHVYPLTINFRCGKNIIKEAQKIVPDIKYFEGSIDGTVETKSMQEYAQSFQEGDVAISRFNKIIIPECFKLIKEGKKATIQGRDFGEQLKNLVKSFKATSIEEFYSKIAIWLDRQSKYLKEGNALDAIVDKFECLKFFADRSDTVEQIYTTIDTIFSDKVEGFKFTTGHRAKGLEWKRVFILDASNFKMRKAGMKAMQTQQEENIYYVAITRAKEYLCYVN